MASFDLIVDGETAGSNQEPHSSPGDIFSPAIWCPEVPVVPQTPCFRLPEGRLDSLLAAIVMPVRCLTCLY